MKKFLYQLDYGQYFKFDDIGETYLKDRGDGMYCWCKDESGKTCKFYMGEEVVPV